MSDQEKPARQGDVRITGSGLGRETRIEVWTGAEWVKLRGVQTVEWNVSAEQALSFTRIELSPAFARFMIPSELVGLEIVLRNADKTAAADAVKAALAEFSKAGTLAAKAYQAATSA